MRLLAQDCLKVELRAKGCRALGLIDCMIYIGLLMALTGVAFATFYECFQHSARLNRAASDIRRVTQAGERWRAEVRAAIGPPKLVQRGAEPVFELPLSEGAVLYRFVNDAVQRRLDSNPNWTTFLPAVKNSQMHIDQRRFVTSCRWELELATGKKPARVKPVFTFQAAHSAKKATP